jgi:RNA polymerase sigma-70 factor (ECF subfamily)
VNQEHGSIPHDPAQFRTTRWSAIFVAAESQMPGSQEALTALCRDYWYPIYAFARRAGQAPPDAQDLTQGFFLSLLQRRALKRVDPSRGKFRSFLLASFKNYLSDELDRARAIKRGGDREFVFLDAADAESRYQYEPADQLTPEKIYDARWAITLLTRAVDRLREECIASGETSRFEVLRPFVGAEIGQAPPTYEEVAKTLGISLGAAKTWVHRFRKRYTALLREEVWRTVSDPNEIDDEIRALCDALVSAEGRL